MATLTIGDTKVTVDDAFLSMSPAEQQVNVEEIAQSLGLQGPNTPVQPPQSVQGGNHIKLTGSVPPKAVQDEQGSYMDPLRQGITFGFSDEIDGLKGGIGRLFQGGDFGAGYQQGVDVSRARLNNYRQEHPWVSTGLEVVGSVPTSLIGGGAALGAKGATLAGRAITGAVVGAGQGAVYGAGAANGDLKDRGVGAVIGGGIGGGFGAIAPFLGNWAAKFARRGAQGRVLDQAAKAVQTSGELKTAASRMFESATGGTPPAVQPQAYQRIADSMRSQAAKMRLNENLSAKGVGLMQMIDQMASEMGNGVVIDLGDLHILRQVAGEIMQSNEGASKAFASFVTNNLDDFIRNLKPADILGAQDPRAAAQALFNGISTWSRANKVSLVEEAIRKGQSAASGPEKGVRNALRSLVNNRSVWNRFNEAEQQAILDVVNGTPGSNLMKLIGTFGFGGNQATSGTGGAIGLGLGSLIAGPAGMIAAPIIGSASRRASERITNRLANRALGAIGAPRLNVVPPVDQARVTAIEAALRRLSAPAGGRSQETIKPILGL